MIDYYFAIIFFGVFIMIIMKLMLHNDEMLEEEIKKNLNIVATIIIIASIAEWLGVQLDGAPLWTRPYHILIKTTELSLAPIIPFMCAEIVGKIKRGNVVRGLLILHACLEVVSAFSRFIFYVDKSNIYHHGEAYWFYILSYVMGIAIFVLVVADESRHQYGMQRALMMLLPVFAICGLVFQYVLGEIRVIWLCTAIDVLLMYVLYLEMTQNLDALTHLLNRRCYESRISNMQQDVVIFYFDVDDFKHINDTYGHAYGDASLSVVGKVIRRIFAKEGMCYRIGGDEFAAITTIPSRDAESYSSVFFREIERQREKDERLPFVSVGYAHFDPKRDSITDVINKADEMMYAYKHQNKARRSNAGV